MSSRIELNIETQDELLSSPDMFRDPVIKFCDEQHQGINIIELMKSSRF